MMKTHKTKEQEKKSLFESGFWLVSVLMCIVVEVIFLARQIEQEHYIIPFYFDITLLIVLVCLACYWAHDFYTKTKFYFYD